MDNRILSLILYLMTAMPLTALANTNITSDSDAALGIAKIKELKGLIVDENKAPIDFAVSIR